MASKKKTKNFIIEIAGIILIGFSVFMICCLISYHPDDPSFETGLSSYPAEIHNWGKSIGAWISSFLFQVFGLGAYIVPISMLLFSLKLLFYPTFYFIFYIRTFFYFLLFLCAETFLNLFFGKLNLTKYKFEAGGAIGKLISDTLTGYLGLFGNYLIIILLGLLIIMGLTKVSYVKLWKQLGGALLKYLHIPVNYLASWLKVSVKKIFSWVHEIYSRHSFEKKKKGALLGRKSTIKDQIGFNSESPIPQEIESDNIPIKVYREEESSIAPAKDGQDLALIHENSSIDYVLPSLDLLDDPVESNIDIDHESLRADAEILIQKLADFSVLGRIVEINPGPVITRFEFEPAPGIKLKRIESLSDDLALALKAMSVRIAPIPGKSVVGIEIPNKKRKNVAFKEIISREGFLESKSRLTIALGKDIAGGTTINDLSRMPHLLVAGTTGSGKSIFVNTVICSILFKATPDEVRFLMIDPKRLELFPYDGIPHLLHPVVIDPRKAAVALRWVVEEMDRRYEILAVKGARDIVQYNKRIEKALESGQTQWGESKKMNYIVVVIDELADLMMIAARDVEGYIARLAQMARASGIHLLIATQRPSVDILTGVIKANFSSRISFQVSTKVDSRTILDAIGAEKLLGMGDMLFMPPGTSKLQRIHGAHISEKEIERITEFIKKQGRPLYDESIVTLEEGEISEDEDEEYDELYDKALALVTNTQQASISMLQRKMRVGYNRAARMIERMEKEGVIGPSDGVKPREVLVNKL